MDGQVVFLRVLWFSPTFDERSARYKWNILERAVKPKSKKTKQKKPQKVLGPVVQNIVSLTSLLVFKILTVLASKYMYNI